MIAQLVVDIFPLGVLEAQLRLQVLHTLLYKLDLFDVKGGLVLLQLGKSLLGGQFSLDGSRLRVNFCLIFSIFA